MSASEFMQRLHADGAVAHSPHTPGIPAVRATMAKLRAARAAINVRDAHSAILRRQLHKLQKRNAKYEKKIVFA